MRPFSEHLLNLVIGFPDRKINDAALKHLSVHFISLLTEKYLLLRNFYDLFTFLWNPVTQRARTGSHLHFEKFVILT